MNPGSHNANGYRATNLASTSSQSYHDFLPHHSNSPSFLNDVPPQLQQPQQQEPQQYSASSMSGRVPHSQWQQLAMQMNGNGSRAADVNSHSPQPGAQQMPPPQFTQMPWGNQMPPAQGFPNGMPNMGFGMPFFPQQILQEAYAMSAPVEAADEPFLLTKLLDASRRGESYKDSLNSMHGKNGHSSSLWKDYYLDHKGRIDAWIAMCLQKEREQTGVNGTKRSASSDVERVKTSFPSIKKPSPASFKREPSPHNSASRLSISAPPVKRTYNKKPKQQSTTPIPLEPSQSTNKRSTINSLTAPLPVFGGRLPAPHADIKIPDPPSRSPTPPTLVVQATRGNKYTPEDREYFIKFVGWRLKQDPTLTRNEICDLIAQKAPHHTSQSWASHWSNNHDVPDKILAAARGEDVNDHDPSSEEESAPIARKPKYKDVTTSEEESGSEDEGEGDDGDEDEDDAEDDDEDEDRPIRHYKDTQMSGKGAAFNEADMYITAKYISSLPNWNSMSSRERWEPYGKKYPQRSHKSWAEYYRRYESGLLKMVKKIKKEAQNSINTQCARPARTPPNAKRKHDIDLESNEDSSIKRPRS